jgi:hypothetical protein
LKTLLSYKAPVLYCIMEIIYISLCIYIFFYGLGLFKKRKYLCFRRAARVNYFYDATRPQTRKYFLLLFSTMKWYMHYDISCFFWLVSSGFMVRKNHVRSVRRKQNYINFWPKSLRAKITEGEIRKPPA